MNDPNLKYALPAALFFALLAFLLFTHGNHLIQSMSLLALFMGAMSQFLAQDNGVVQRVTSAFFAIFGILLIGVAMIMFQLA